MDASSIASSSNEIVDEPHVLAVDDNVIDRKLVEKLLKSSSCKVTTAESGLRALELLGLVDGNSSGNKNASKVNMIITDYCMPGMNGYELLKKIKESSVLKNVPVVIMSSENVPTRINRLGICNGNDVSIKLDRCLEEGAEMFMLKPLKHADVKKLRCQFLR